MKELHILTARCITVFYSPEWAIVAILGSIVSPSSEKVARSRNFLTRWRHLVTRLISMRPLVFHIFISLEKSKIVLHPILIMRQVCQTRFSSTFLRRKAVLFCRSTNLYVCACAKRHITHVAASARLSKLCRPYREHI